MAYRAGVKKFDPHFLGKAQKIQLLVNKYASHGKLVYNKNGQWSKKEIIVSDDYVGYAVNSKAKTEQITKSFKIHYSNKGVHIVPREE